MKPINTPLRVSCELMQACECWSGFAGIGEFFPNGGLNEFVKKEECKTG